MNERLPKFKGAKLLAEISKCAAGLSYVSETDAEIEVVSVGRAASVDLRWIVDESFQMHNVREISIEGFFRRLTGLQEGLRDEQTVKAKRPAELWKLLKRNLHDIRVFEIGNVRVDIYVIGLDADNDLVGIKTKAVET